MGYPVPPLPRRTRRIGGISAPLIERCPKCRALLEVTKVKREFDVDYDGKIIVTLECPNRSWFDRLMKPSSHGEEEYRSYDDGAYFEKISYVWI